MTAAFDPRQRHADFLETVQAQQDGRQAQIHTAMPATITAYDASKLTVSVQPSIQAMQSMPDGTVAPLTLSVLKDVPVVFCGGGGHLLSFPIKAGDECLLIFAERSIDFWYQHGGVQKPSDWRMHDINDGFALIGVRSQPNVPGGSGSRSGTAVSGTTTQLRSDDGMAVIELDPGAHAINLAAQAINLAAQAVQIAAAGNHLGFYGAAPIAKPTITGSYGGITALKNLLQALQTMGLIVDAST
jgi:hypothetical protein